MLTPEETLDTLKGSVPALYEVAVRLLGPDARLDATSGALCLARKPRIGSEAYAVRVYPGIDNALISSYEKIHRCHIADSYRCLLEFMNGAHLFEIRLFGVPPLMARSPPQLDRTTAWPLDVGTAQEDWRLDYDTSPTDFFIGYGPYSKDENVGYFLWPNGGIEALRKNGDGFGQWSDFQHFLAEELARAEAVYPDFENAMGRIQRKDSGWHSWLRRISRIV